MPKDVVEKTQIVARPQLPPYLESILVDGRHGSLGAGDPYARWTPPPAEWIERHKRCLQKAASSLRACLEPATERFVRELLATLAIMKPTRDAGPAQWRFLATEYIRLLGHYPADIWRDACHEWSLSSRFFPDASELQALMGPKLAERRTKLARIELMLNAPDETQNTPTPKERRLMGKRLRKLAELLKTGEMGDMNPAQARRVVYESKPDNRMK